MVDIDFIYSDEMNLINNQVEDISNRKEIREIIIWDLFFNRNSISDIEKYTTFKSTEIRHVLKSDPPGFFVDDPRRYGDHHVMVILSMEGEVGFPFVWWRRKNDIKYNDRLKAFQFIKAELKKINATVSTGNVLEPYPSHVVERMFSKGVPLFETDETGTKRLEHFGRELNDIKTFRIKNEYLDADNRKDEISTLIAFGVTRGLVGIKHARTWINTVNDPMIINSFNSVLNTVYANFDYDEFRNLSEHMIMEMAFKELFPKKYDEYGQIENRFLVLKNRNLLSEEQNVFRPRN